MAYNPFDYVGTDKRKRVSSKAMDLAQGAVTEQKLREMVREEIENINEAGIDKSYKAIMKLEKEIDGLEKIFRREKSGMTRDRARKMEKSIRKLKMAWHNLYSDTQSR